MLDRFQAAIGPACWGRSSKTIPPAWGASCVTPAGEFSRIVEHKDASLAERTIKEVNMSTYLFKTPELLWALSKLENSNAQGEFYLTDCPQILKDNRAQSRRFTSARALRISEYQYN